MPLTTEEREQFDKLKADWGATATRAEQRQKEPRGVLRRLWDRITLRAVREELRSMREEIRSHERSIEELNRRLRVRIARGCRQELN